ncbi:2-dehydro-3-deoxy-6-phosphogalactonate aldolase [uncultured Stenotrophomonas sp.]|uniref:2-dehydro-3-deoxy-6-phosphogalactonate aldolase n=1 Tax=uncultured Stenotrophomonas sp. TaxID=165438 RepID=UPI0025DDFF87|nr:2-dehydro-3-deoxy-6-phosphogalactonate aldolase [uncultured Stenotrophomonas sp.]
MNTAHAAAFDAAIEHTPLVAILRGLTGTEALAVGQALVDAGVRMAEVPLNSPDPLATIALLAAHFGDRLWVGAGTVLEVAQVEALAATGCRFCVSPNTNPEVIAAARAHGMEPMPGFSTATEAFAALAAGARYLKAFPAHDSAPRLSALSAVLPAQARLVAVGGFTTDALPALWQAGVRAVGIGADLYRPGRAADEVGRRARHWLQALRAVPASGVRLTCDAGTLVGESPVVLDDGRVAWVEPTAPALLHWDGQACSRTPLSEPVWSLAVTPQGLVGNGETHFVRIADDGGLQPGPTIDVGAGCRLNDMTVDARGGLWAGSMHRGLLGGRGALFHAAAVDAPVRRVAEDLGVANGMVFSPEGDTLYVIDTLARTLLAYPADVAAGTLGEPRVVTDFLGEAGKPDGLALSPQGSLWVAMWGGACVLELAANGAVQRRLAVPAPHVGALCFAPDGRLFITTARARLGPDALQRAPGSGGLFIATP